ncbi:MAG: hypothetical protein DCC48_16300 [Acidobacteria bacterium]|nr:MAG: hypothetical protein DCC48_16300 [Acidobacteriota bacterium]
MNKWRILSAALFLLGLAAMGWAFYATLDESGNVLPPLGYIVGGFGVALVAYMLAARMWIALFDGLGDHRILAGAFYTSQVAKYLPVGGALQVAGQVSLSRQDEIALGRAAIVYPVFALAAVASAATLSAGLSVTADHLPWSLRWLFLLGLLAPLLLIRSLTRWVLDTARRLIKRIPSSKMIPSQAAIWRAYGWGLLNMAVYGASFAIVFHPLAPDVGPVHVTLSFVLAWLVGFLALPVPAGLGVREGVLIALPPIASTGAGRHGQSLLTSEYTEIT